MQRTNWAPLFLTNFLGVLNDNLFKNLISFIAILWFPVEYKSQIIGYATASLVLPYILFSSFAGKLTKEHSKAKIIQICKLIEMPVMLMGFFGFYYLNIYVVLSANIILGFIACMYSPSKYGIIREIGGKEKISYGTGGMEMFTFLGVLIGTGIAGYVADLALPPEPSKHLKLIIFTLLMGFALAGWLLSLAIHPKEEAIDASEHMALNPISFTLDSFNWSKSIKGINFSILGLGFFWMIASLIQLNMILYGPEQYGLTNTQTSFIMAALAIGIGLGSFIAGILSDHQVKTSLSPIGGIGMGLSSLAIYLLNLPLAGFVILVISTAFFAGFYKVPLNAFIQDRVKGRKLGIILAYNNISDFMFILISAGLFMLIEAKLGSHAVFLISAILMFTTTLIVYIKIPNAKFDSLFKHPSNFKYHHPEEN